MRAAQLVTILQESHDRHERDVASNALLDEVFRGYPFDKLVPFLHGDDPGMVESIAWILSELGEGGPAYAGTAAYMPEVDRLLGNSAVVVRLHAILAVMSAAGKSDGVTIAKAIRQATDGSSAIRSMVRLLLAYGTDEQLRAGLANLQAGAVCEELEWLLNRGSDPALSSDVVRRLDNGDELGRMFALAAAARVGRYDSRPLEHASRSSDEDVSKFAALAIKNVAFQEKRRARLGGDSGGS
jgi:hypothetical protein